MKASNDHRAPASLLSLQVTATLIGASGLLKFCALTFPLDEWANFTGAPVLFAGISLVLWAFLTLVGVGIACWIQLKCVEFSLTAWLSLIAGELFFRFGIHALWSGGRTCGSQPFDMRADG